MSLSRCLPFTLFFVLLISQGFSQMPDWKYFRDREGNSYYYDKAFKIRIAEERDFDYPPVSASGAKYYFNRGVEYINEHHHVKGLYFLKSLMCLESENRELVRIKSESSRWINYMRKRQGTRFDDYDMASSVLHVRKGRSFVIINEKMFYSLNCITRPHVVSRQWKNMKKRFSLRLGFVGEKGASAGGYDYVAAVESRDFGFRPVSIDEAAASHDREYGTGKIVRRKISSSDEKIICTFSYPDGSPFTGYEAWFLSGSRLHFIKVMCHNSLREKVIKEMENLVSGFRPVRP